MSKIGISAEEQTFSFSQVLEITKNQKNLSGIRLH